MSTKRHVIQFTLDWLRLRTKLFVFTSIFSFRCLVKNQHGQFSLQDNSVGSLLYVVLWNTFIFHINNSPVTRLMRMPFWSGIRLSRTIFLPFFSEQYCVISHVFAVLYCTLSVTFNTLTWTIASACQTTSYKATVTLIVLLNLYAHIRVICHA